MGYQITAKIWIVGDSHEEADKVYAAINALPGVAEMYWLDGEEI